MKTKIVQNIQTLIHSRFPAFVWHSDIFCFQEGQEEIELNSCEKVLSEAKKKISWPFSKLWSGIKGAVSWIKEKYNEKCNDSKKEQGEIIHDLFDEEKVKKGGWSGRGGEGH